MKFKILHFPKPDKNNDMLNDNFYVANLERCKQNHCEILESVNFKTFINNYIFSLQQHQHQQQQQIQQLV